MIGPAERTCVERTKEAQTISIIINGGMQDEFIVNVRPERIDMKKLAHDIAISLQSAFNNEI